MSAANPEFHAPMEILELIYAVIQFAGCCLELTAGASGVGAGVTGTKAYQRHKTRQQGKEAGQTDLPSNPYLWTFLILLFVSFFLVGVVVWKWVQGPG